MSTIAITGSASGMGAATRTRLEKAGHSVIGIDIRDADIIADLGTVPGRRAAIDAVRKRTANRLDGLVVCAGVGPQVEPWSTIVSINYFGAQVLLEGLRDALAAGTQPAAVAVASNSASLPGVDTPIVEACLAGDEEEARRLALTFSGHHATTRRPLKVSGWEEWELDDDLKVKASLGWYDADDYARQVEGA